MVDGQKIKTLLEQKGLDQQTFAELVGVHPSAICFFIKGYKSPSVAVLKRIADALGVTMDDLVVKEGM